MTYLDRLLLAYSTAQMNGLHAIAQAFLELIKLEMSK